MWWRWVVMNAYKKKYLLHVPVVAKTLRGKDRFPSTSPCNVILYCVEGDKPSISAFLALPGSVVVTWSLAAPDGELTSTTKLSKVSSGASQARLRLVEDTLTVRFPNMARVKPSGSDPEPITPVSDMEGASVFKGRRRSEFWTASVSTADCGVDEESSMLSISLSWEVGFAATVDKSRLKHEYCMLPALLMTEKLTCEEETGLKKEHCRIHIIQHKALSTIRLTPVKISTFSLVFYQFISSSNSYGINDTWVSAINVWRFWVVHQSGSTQLSSNRWWSHAQPFCCCRPKERLLSHLFDMRVTYAVISSDCY